MIARLSAWGSGFFAAVVLADPVGRAAGPHVLLAIALAALAFWCD